MNPFEKWLGKELEVEPSSAMDQNFFRKLDLLVTPKKSKKKETLGFLDLFRSYRLQAAFATAGLFVVAGGIYVHQRRQELPVNSQTVQPEIIQDLDFFLTLDELENAHYDS